MTLTDRYGLQNLELINVITNIKRQITLPLVITVISKIYMKTENIFHTMLTNLQIHPVAWY